MDTFTATLVRPIVSEKSERHFMLRLAVEAAYLGDGKMLEMAARWFDKHPEMEEVV